MTRTAASTKASAHGTAKQKKTATLQDLEARVLALESYVEKNTPLCDTMARVEELEQLLTDDYLNKALSAARSRSLEIHQIYERTYTSFVVMEMVLFTLWKSPTLRTKLGIEDAAIRLVRLLGHGDEYFHRRRAWTIETWILHLADLTEEDMPSCSTPE